MSGAESGRSARYRPEIFDVDDERGARSIILTPEGGQSSELRWATETPALVEDILARVPIRPGQLVLDFGCGIGRVARELIARTSCRVIGVDISASMRRLAVDYVGSELFSVVSRDLFVHMVASGLRVHHALAIWVLQHSPEVDCDVEMLYRSMVGEGSLYLLNNRVSAIPTDHGWVSDGVDIRAELRRRFAEIAVYPPSSAWANATIAEHAICGHFLRPPVVEQAPADG